MLKNILSKKLTRKEFIKTLGIAGLSTPFLLSGVDAKTLFYGNNAKLSDLSTDGFVKTINSDGTFTVDTNTYLTDAPSDGTTYGRKDGGWSAVAAGGDELVKVSANDTTAGYLNGKLVAGLNASLTEDNDGANETLTVKGKAEVQTGPPSTPHTGAIWYDTDEPVTGIGNLVGTSPISVTNGNNAVLGSGTTVSVDLSDYYIAVKSISSTTTLVDSDNIVLCTGTFTVDLPTAVGLNGKVYNIKNVSTGVITVDANTTETIEDELTQTLNEGDSMTIVSNNSNWKVI